MGKLFDIMSPMGQYTDPATGQEKTRWLKCGAVIQGQNGKTSIKLDAMPVAPPNNDQSGEGGIWLQCFAPDNKQQAPQAQAQGFRQPSQAPVGQAQGNPNPPAPPVPYTDANFQGAPTPEAPTPPAPQGNNPPW